VLCIAKHGLRATDAEFNKLRSVAFFTAALFVTHPIMTNAVTYITQRMTSMVTLFYLGTVVLYVRYQNQELSKNYRNMLYVVAIISCCAAMLTKETAITLPITLVVLDLAFCRSGIKQRLARLTPFLLTIGIIPYFVLGLKQSDNLPLTTKLVSAINLVNFTGISSADYFITQLKVIPFYLQLMVVPKGLSLEHEFPLSTSLMDPGIPGSILFHTLFIGFAGWLLYSSRKSSSFPDIMKYVAGFGIVWFYLTLSVTSSIIPITEPAVEWRLYLPATGIFIFTVCILYAFMAKYFARTASTLFSRTITVLIVVYLGLTLARNEDWRVPEKFWRQTISQYPFLGRPYMQLADYYLALKKPEEAIKVYQEAIGCIQNLTVLRYELGNVYIEARRYEEAVRTLEEAIALEPDKKEAYLSLAKAKCYLGQFDEAMNIASEGEKALDLYFD